MKTESPTCTNVEISLDTVLSFLKYGGKLKDNTCTTYDTTDTNTCPIHSHTRILYSVLLSTYLCIVTMCRDGLEE